MPAMPEEEMPEKVYSEVPMPPLGDEVWKIILDRSKIPEVLSHVLKGDMWVVINDAKGNAVSAQWEQRGERLMNDAGARMFTTILMSGMTVDKIATFLTEDEVTRMARDMRDDVIDLLTVRAREFDISSENMSVIVDIVDHFYFSNLTAARKGTLLESMKAVVRRVETYGEKPRSSLGSKVKFW